MHSEQPNAGEIRIGLGSCCQAQGSGQVHEEILSVVGEMGVSANVKSVGCIGMCHQTPLMELVVPSGESKYFSHVQPEDVREIVLKHFRPRSLLQRVTHRLSRWLDELHSDEDEDPVSAHTLDVRDQPVCAFLGPQKHIATEFCGDIDPLDLDEYLRHDGFQALQRCLTELDPDAIIEQVKASGLRGRGGAGFATHIKWQKAREAVGEVKYVICNGDEGDPVRSWTACCWSRFPTESSRGWRSPPVPSGHTRPSSTSAPSIRWPCSEFAKRSAAAAQRGVHRPADLWQSISTWTSASWRGPAPSSAVKKRR